MDHIIDSYSWVEYLIGSKKGQVLKKLFKNTKNEFKTVECCLAELKGWALKNNQEFKPIYDTIKSNSIITKIKEEDWIKAAKERYEQRKTQKDFGLIDAMILTKQKEFNCKIISGDKHFKKIKNVIFT